MIDKTQKLQSDTSWMFLAVGIHATIGASMVLFRYLQTVAGLPGLALVGLSDLVAFLIMSWRVLPKIKKAFWRSKTLWAMIVIVLLRTILLTFAVRFTKTYIVQFINLLAPFIVVVLNRFFIKSKISKNTFLAIILSLIGGGLMIFGGLIDPALEVLWTAKDSIGILLAFLGTFGVAAYMLIVKRGEQIGLPFEIVYISQIGMAMLIMPIISLAIGEDWTPFLNIDWITVLVFFVRVVGVEICCKIGYITILRKLGAPIVSSMLAIRLVSALIFGWVILGEKLNSPLQWGGAALVVLTVTWYLSRQNQQAVSPIVSG